MDERGKIEKRISYETNMLHYFYEPLGEDYLVAPEIQVFIE